MGSIPADVMPRPGACRPNHTLSTEARMTQQLETRFDVTLLLAQQSGCHNAKQTALQLAPCRSQKVKFTQCTPVLVCMGWKASIRVDRVWLFQSVPQSESSQGNMFRDLQADSCDLSLQSERHKIADEGEVTGPPPPPPPNPVPASVLAVVVSFPASSA